jgi:hypothetical protein
LVAPARPAAGAPDARRAFESLVAQLVDGTADPEGRGLQLRGLEPRPIARADLEPRVVEPVLRLARLADGLGATLRDHPDPDVRRSAAILAARAHPLLAALDA